MRRSLIALGIVGLIAASSLGVALAPTGARTQKSGRAAPRGIHKIKHVIVIMQENRSLQ